MRSTATLILLLTAVAAHGQSAPRSISQSVWRISKDVVILQVAFPKTEEESLRAKLLPFSAENLGKYVLERVFVTADGEQCAALDQGYDIGEVNPLALGPTLDGFEIMFGCPAGDRAASELTLHNSLFFVERPTHTDFAFIVKDGVSVLDTFTTSRRMISVPRIGVSQSVSRNRFAHLGLAHIWQNADQWLALAGFFLVLRGRQWLTALLAYVGGGVLAAALVATGRLIPYADAAGVGMGLVVAGLAVVLVSRTAKHSKTLSWALAIGGAILGAVAWLFHRSDSALVLFGFGVLAAATARLPRQNGFSGTLLALLYGFVEGMILPTDFARLQIGERLPAIDSLAFAAGALFSAALVMALLASAYWLLRNVKLPAHALLQDLAGATMAGFGVFWVATRLLLKI